MGVREQCTNGFTSVDRMSAVLGDYGTDQLSWQFGAVSLQVVVPEINFTCSGSILSWVFGAQWEGDTDSYTELQIWRPGSRDGVYSKVGSTTIMTKENSTRLYQYSLSSPLPFRAGDVLGYYQGSSHQSQLRLLYEDKESSPQFYYTEQTTSSTQFNIENGTLESAYHVLISVRTGELCMYKNTKGSYSEM